MNSDTDAIHSVQVVSSIEDEASGPSYSVVRLAEALASRGTVSEVMSLAASPGQSTTNGVIFHRFQVDQRPLPVPTRLAPSAGLCRAVNDAARAGAVLHVHGLWRMANVYPGLAATRTGAPLVLSPRGMLGSPALRFSHAQKQLFWHLIQRRALRQLVCVHATSLSELNDVRAFGLEVPVAIIPNGIDMPPKSTVMRPGRKRRVLYLGRIHPKKGIDRLLHAWALVEPNHSDWDLSIVGPFEQPHTEKLKSLAHTLGLSRVHFEGPLYGAEKQAAYASAAIFVLPTLNENFGMVVAEALAQGTPVISTRGAPWQGLTREGCGWWIEHGKEPLAAALSEAMTSGDEARARMGARGRDWMVRDFSWDGIAEKMNHLYHWCAGRGDKPEFVEI